jgi:hypothetical protein
MFDNTGMQILPLLLGLEDLGFAQETAVDALNARPPHEFLRHKALDKVTMNRLIANQVEKWWSVLMQLKSREGGIDIEMMKHVGLFIIVWCKNHVVNDVF